MGERLPLSAARIVEAAVSVADRAGLGGVSMRSVGRELGVEAMSLYHHIAGKEALLDALGDWIFDRIGTPGADQEWREAMAARARSVRAVLSAHPWALSLIETRRAGGAATFVHHDAVLGTLRRGGFSVRLAAHAFAVLDAFVYGFVLNEQNLPFDAEESPADLAAEDGILDLGLPHLAEMVTEVVMTPGYAFADEFDYGLELILDALAARAQGSA
jgi:AcrR family transcriptional regulator